MSLKLPLGDIKHVISNDQIMLIAGTVGVMQSIGKATQ